MADDELIIPIDKAFWPRGVMRGLTPLLRSLGDKHGNLVIAAVPNKHIMLKGPANHIEAVKAPLRALVEEHFPEAPVPEELGGDAEEEQPAAAAPAPAAKSPKVEPKASPKRAPEPAPAAPAKTSWFGGASKKAEPAATSKAAAAGSPSKPASGRKTPRPAAMVAPDLLWECVRKNSSFLRKPSQQMKRSFSAEPCNLLAYHSQKFSGVSSSEALDVRPLKVGKKESIELVQSHSKASRHRRPSAAQVTLGLSKCPKRGLARLDCEIDAKFYRREMLDLARAKYKKVQQSFKTKKRIVKSRRSKN